MRKIEEGQTVTIYHDPTTEQNPEGEAMLVSKLIDGEEQQYWEVRFVAGDWQETYNRWIKVSE